ncbi:MAG: toll/interleukin-1 receptor domain-containing protein [Planctomycetota bacterium]
MAYIPGSAFDVFISYAHVDDIPESDGDAGWVERFEQQLSIRMLKRVGERVGFWRDPELRRSERFDDAIQTALRGSSLMISLITPRYLKSDYCRQEVDWFRTKAEQEPEGMLAGRSVRVIPVLLYNLPPEDWPEPCQGTSGHRFFDAEDDDIGEPLEPDSDAFKDRMKVLVKELHEALTSMKEAAQTPPPTHEPEPAGDAEDIDPNAFKVFLSHPPDSLGPVRRQLASKLAAKEGIHLLGEIPPPHEDSDHHEAVRRAVETADLSVHLLGVTPGEPIDEADHGRTYPVEQVNVGLEHASSQLILMPDDLDLRALDDGSYSEFLNELIDRKRDGDQLEVVRTGRHEMLDEILAKRERIEQARQREAAQQPGAPFVTFIDLHMSDLTHATELVGYLGQQEIQPVMIPAAENSPTEGMNAFLDNVSRANLLLVVYGAVERNWVQQRILEASKLILVNKLNTQVGVYVAPPNKPADAVMFAPYDVALNMGRFDPSTLAPILAKARGG